MTSSWAVIPWACVKNNFILLTFFNTIHDLASATPKLLPLGALKTEHINSTWWKVEPIKFHDKNNHIHQPNFKGRLILTNHYSPKSEIHETTLETTEYSLFLREKYPQLTILHQCSSFRISLKKISHRPSTKSNSPILWFAMSFPPSVSYDETQGL